MTAFVSLAQAATITVDGSTCDLQDAVVAANTDTSVGGCPAGAGADTLVLTANQTYTLDYAKRADDSTGIFVSSQITIEGNGATIRRATDDPNAFRLMAVVNDGALSIRDATLTGGRLNGGDGGGLVNLASLSLERVWLHGNVANGRGGGLFNAVVSTIVASTVSDNQSAEGAGGIQNQGVLVLRRSTLSGNVGSSTFSDPACSSTAAGGLASCRGATTTVTDSTITRNRARFLAGGMLLGGTIDLRRNIIAGNSVEISRNSANEIFNFDISTAVLDRNLFGHAGETNAAALVGFGPRATDFNATSDGDGVSQRTGPAGTSLDAILNPELFDNGGTLPTHALPAGSPALDAIPASEATNCDPARFDQRGAPRGQDGDGDAIAGCDIGAVERQITDLDLGFSLGANVITAGGSSPGTDGIEVTLSLANLGPGTSVGSRLKMQWNAPLIFEGLSPACTVTPLSFECPGETYAPGQTVVLRPTLRADASQPEDVQIRLVADFIPAAADVDPVPATGHAEQDLLVRARDGEPDAFTFGRLEGAARSQQVQSDVVTVTGITHSVTMDVEGGEFQLVDLNIPPSGVRGVCSASGRWRRGAVQVAPNMRVCVRHTTSAQFGTDTVTTLTIGGVSGTFTSTTLARDITPDAFGFDPVSGVAREELQTSNAVSIEGINDPAPFTVSDGFAAINDGPCTRSAGTVSAGDRLRLCHVSAADFGATTTTIVTVGADGVLAGVSATFTSATIAPPVATLSAASLRFGAGLLRVGPVRLGRPSEPQTLTITNTGAAPLTISGVSTTGDFTADSGCGSALEAGAQCVITLRFIPSRAGERSGELRIDSNAPNSPARVALSGRGVGLSLALGGQGGN